jgi:signal transduction histidine kinase
MVITLLTFSALAFFSYMRLTNLIEYSRLVEETNEIKFKTEQCLSFLRDAETGARGFLMTKDTAFLRPLTEGNISLYQGLADLTALSQKSSESVIFIRAFRAATIRKIAYLNRLVYNFRKTPANQIGREMLMQDRVLMEQARQYAIAAEKNLDRKLAKRNETKNTYLVATPKSIIILSFSALILILGSYIVIIRELRKRIRTQNDLEENIAALRSSNMELEQFAYIASHDLQEPLRKIRTFGNRLSEKYSGNLSEDAQNMISRMQSSAEHMQLLMNDLLTYSSLVDQNSAKQEKVDLNVCLQKVLRALNEQIEEKHAVVQAAELPAISGRPEQLEQLFHNLVCNSLKFTQKGRDPQIIIDHETVSGEVIVSRDANPDRQYHKISFRDNGVGFNESFKDKLFVIFQRLHPKAEYPGTGIGLAICKKVVTNHQGIIQATGKPQEGTVFTVYLPTGNL